MAENNANPASTENEEVEEQTAPPSSGDESQDPQTQEDDSRSEEEAAPSEEEETPEESEPTGEEESEGEPSEEEAKQTKSRKGRGLQTRLKQVLSENAELKSQKQPQPQAGQTAPPQQPQPANLQAQAQDAVQQIDAYQQQYGELPEQISPEEYVHLQRMAAGQVQVQQDTQQAMADSAIAREVAQLRNEFAAEKAKAQAAERTNEVLTAVREAEDENPILREGTNEYDGEFADTVLDDLKEALDTDADRVAAGLKPNLDVKKFIEKRVKVYRLAQSKGGEKASAELAKQAAGSAVPPSGSIKRGNKSPDEMSPEELAKAVGADWDLKK